MSLYQLNQDVYGIFGNEAILRFGQSRVIGFIYEPLIGDIVIGAICVRERLLLLFECIILQCLVSIILLLVFKDNIKPFYLNAAVLKVLDYLW